MLDECFAPHSDLAALILASTDGVNFASSIATAALPLEDYYSHLAQVLGELVAMRSGRSKS